MNSGNQIIYIPEYVEEGISKLQDAKRILEEISSEIESGITIINGSGYNRGIPYIEKGDTAALALEKMKSIIALITSEIEKYSNGEALELENAIIIANPETAEKYGLTKEDIDYTLAEYLFENTVSPKWDSNYLTASAGSNRYYAKDGRLAKETWCDLNPNNLVRLMKKEGIDLDFWIREDGVYMYGDYVMVAADIPHMDGSEQAAEYRKGDLVETSLGTGIVVDYCGMAEKVRKKELAGTKEGDVEVWYDIYTAWHDGGQYQHVGYCNDPSCTSSHHGTSTMIEKSQNPTSSSQLRNTTTQATTSQNVFATNTNATSITNQTTSNSNQITIPVINNSNSSTSFGGGSTGNSTNISTNAGVSTSTTTTPVINNSNTNTGNNVNTIVPDANNSSINTNPNPNINTNTNPNPNTNININANTNTNTNTSITPPPETNNSAPNINESSSTNITTTPETNQTNQNPPTNIGSINNWDNYQNTTPQITTPNTNYTNNNYSPSNPIQDSTIPENITSSPNEMENMNQTQIIPENNQEMYSSQFETNVGNNRDTTENKIIQTDNSTTQTKEKFNPLPIVAGVGVTAAAGVGLKVYVDNKKKKEESFDDADEEFEQLEEI